MNLTITLTLVAVGVAIYFLFFRKPKTASWKYIRANSPIALPENEPQMFTSPNGLPVRSERTPPPELLAALEDGVITQLFKTTKDIPFLNPPDIWKQWNRFARLSDYEIVLIPEMAKAVSADIAGCSILRMNNGITVIGTVVGWHPVINRARIDAPRPIIVLPFPEDLSPRCLDLMRDGARNESAHVRLINNFDLFMFYQGENDVHPIFPFADVKVETDLINDTGAFFLMFRKSKKMVCK